MSKRIVSPDPPSAPPAKPEARRSEVLSLRDAVRKRTGIFVDGVLEQGRSSLLANCIDSSIRRRSRSIAVVLHADGSTSVEDDGEPLSVLGCACSVEDRREISGVELEFLFESVGIAPPEIAWWLDHYGFRHPRWSFVNTYLSEWLDVEVSCEGARYHMRFEEGGARVGALERRGESDRTGVRVHYKPGDEIFGRARLDFARAALPLERTAFLLPGIAVSLRDEVDGRSATWRYDEGIRDYLRRATEGMPLLYGAPIHEFVRRELEGSWRGFHPRTGAMEIEVAILHVDAPRDTRVEAYVNLLDTYRGGSHRVGVLKGIARALEDHARRTIPGFEGEITRVDARWGLFAVVAVRHQCPDFIGGSKIEFWDRQAAEECARTTSARFGTFLEENPALARELIDRALAARAFRAGAGSLDLAPERDECRLRPRNRFEDLPELGAHPLLEECVDNAVATTVATKGGRVEVALLADGSAEVRDDGKGIPVKRPRSRKARSAGEASSLETILTDDRCWSRYEGADRPPFFARTGSLALVNYLSEWLEVEVRRGGATHAMRFEIGGILVRPLERVGRTREHGTRLRFLPDPRILPGFEWDPERIAGRLRELAVLLPGTTFALRDERSGRSEEWSRPGGVIDWIRETSVPLLSEPIRVFARRRLERRHREDLVLHDRVEIDIAFGYASASGDGPAPGRIRSFANLHETPEGGLERVEHLVGFLQGLREALQDHVLRVAPGRFEGAFSGDRVRRGLVAIVTVRSSHPYRWWPPGEMLEICRKPTRETFARFLKANPELGSRIAERISAASDRAGSSA